MIRTTDEHPFWVAGRGWVTAGNMRVGDRVNEADDSNDAVVVSSVREAYPEGVTVYNVEVRGDHTYFVADAFGQANVAVWVHNVCGGAKFYQDNVANVYGGVQPRSATKITTLSGKTRYADNLVSVNGVYTAVEAKFTSNWSKSIYNPASKVGSKSFAKAVRANQLAQARYYLEHVKQYGGQVIYHSNSQELADHYRDMFSKGGLDMSRIKFVVP